MGPPWRIDPTTHRTMSERFYHGATSRSLRKLSQFVYENEIAQTLLFLGAQYSYNIYTKHQGAVYDMIKAKRDTFAYKLCSWHLAIIISVKLQTRLYSTLEVIWDKT